MLKISAAHPSILTGERIPLLASRSETGDTLIILRDETAQQQLVADLQQYAHFVAHELKNPLTSIMALTELLQQQAPQESAQQIAGELLASGERMRQIIQELLLASVPQPGIQDLEAVDVQPVTVRVVDRILSDSPEAMVVVETPAPWPAVWGRSTWIEQILSNLIENALEHGGDGAVRITARTEAQQLRISVIDNGTSTVFQSTQYNSATESTATTQSQRCGRGLYPRGLGLSVVRLLVEKSGGEMGIESPRRHCTTAWFTLPLAASSAAFWLRKCDLLVPAL